jgi:UDP-N-acetyl-alpha-D-muramoyl-L-alanyl-L-glutamate epimerase
VPSERRAGHLEELRAEHPTFVYAGYDWHEGASGTLDCSFLFHGAGRTFRPTCRFTFGGPRERRPVHRGVMDNLVFHLGLAELPSYWKATCSPRVEIRAGDLTAEQAAFWTWILTEGMGEFHYVNRTSFADPGFVSVVGGSGRPHAVSTDRLEDGHVIPVGGGKDSLVTLDLLGRRTDAITTIAINPPPSTEAAIGIADVAARVVVDRRIDPRLLELNEAGFLNGHTPFGAVVGFTSALAAVLLGRRYIALSNESSSDHATLVYRGRVINHQLGKSSAFEAALHRYLRAHVASELHYFSVLRPFNELQIAQRFAELTAFHPAFRSCNRGRKTDTWCGRCPKCLSTFIVLAPFVARPALVRIFGNDLLLDPACKAILPSLLTEDGAERPFECVATPAELRAALGLCRGEPLGRTGIELLTHRAATGLVPEDLYAAADAALRPRLSPLLATAAVGVVGLGLEGTSTCRHLLSSTVPLDLTVIDDDAAAAHRLPSSSDPSQRVRFLSGTAVATSAPDLDVVFKSPGIARNHPAIDALRHRPSIVASNTELFFERCTATIVGVTGTKGKSTATSLIAHVLGAAGKDARLVGNIGRPCLDEIERGESGTIYCVELSSFQLESLRTSPHIAVVLGIFGDHLDRYGEIASYVAAKSSITRFQTRHDTVLYNADCPRATALAELGVARRVPFGRERPALLGGSRGPLQGAFNNYNLWPAILVGRAFGVEDAALAASISSFRALPGRLETVVDKEGVRFVCDIRSTAPEVTVAALEALSEDGQGVDFLFLGGVDRHQDYRTLVPALERSPVRHVVLFPPTGGRIRALLESTPLTNQPALFEPRSMEEAVRYVYRLAPAGRSVCLMSTGAPSSGGLFSGPEDKSRQFAHWATKLGRREAASAC